MSFNAGHAGSDHYAVLNNNDKWTYADPLGINVSFGASTITITNRSGIPGRLARRLISSSVSSKAAAASS